MSVQYGTTRYPLTNDSVRSDLWFVANKWLTKPVALTSKFSIHCRWRVNMLSVHNDHLIAVNGDLSFQSFNLWPCPSPRCLVQLSKAIFSRSIATSTSIMYQLVSLHMTSNNLLFCEGRKQAAEIYCQLRKRSRNRPGWVSFHPFVL